jgi:hypothetical protein
MLDHAFTAYLIGYTEDGLAGFWFGSMIMTLNPESLIFYRPNDPTIPPQSKPIEVLPAPPIEVVAPHSHSSAPAARKSRRRKSRKSRMNRTVSRR